MSTFGNFTQDPVLNPVVTGSNSENRIDAPDVNQLAQEAIELAAQLLESANQEQNAAERAQGAQMARMMDDPEGKAMTMALSDQAFRSHNSKRVANQLKFILETYGVPKYMSWWERLALKYGVATAQFVPQLVIPLIIAKLRQETNQVILPGEEIPLKNYISKRNKTNTRLNLNQLGEAVLGEGEAAKRFEAYLELLRRPDVEYVSVKISSIFSQINLAAYDYSLEQIKERLRELYTVAQTNSFVKADGSTVPKFVNLDMEEYRDLSLTMDAFMQVLSEKAFVNHKAGIVLQAYLPDSYNAQQVLTDWAIERVRGGGSSIKIRIVKGANLAMEQVEASLMHWEQAPYYSKVDVDANYKRMLLFAMQPERAKAVQIGVASHNLFDIAFALKLREYHKVNEFVELEMLEGMANHQARVVQATADGLLLYAPIVKRQDFHSAIAYLVRRLDENTAEENFLHDLFGLEVDTPAWEKQKDLFLEAVAKIDTVSKVPNREQNRMTEVVEFSVDDEFKTVADTDFSLPANREWLRGIVDKWKDVKPEEVPLQIAGEFVNSERKADGYDPSRTEAPTYTYNLATEAQIDKAIATAKAAQGEWAATTTEHRKQLLMQCATGLEKNRADLIGAAILDGAKAIPQADVEVSEAIDFANYYARAFDNTQTEFAGYTFKPYGTILITTPWNFPVAIPTGGMLSSLMAGNTVIIKPAPEAVFVSWQLVNILWDAGIPKEVLQFVPTSDDDIGKHLVTHDHIDAVILTGSYETARMFQSWKPSLRLFAETSGKNSMIITAMADQDQAIKDLVYSAFGHNGQKCSAASLAVIEAEVYDSPIFRRQLKDAAESLHVGSAWDLSSKVSPLISETNPALQQARTTLDEGESWLLEPKLLGANLWSPGIKLGIKPDSFYHRTECFGPVLGLMRVDSLEEAVAVVNTSDFGLTGGIQSLDKREIDYWREHIQVGNAYINRGTTGAIVERQPFGGWKKSAFGIGAKAGGPNYVWSLGEWSGSGVAEVDNVSANVQSMLNTMSSSYQDIDVDTLSKVAGSYAYAYNNHFALDHDPSQILGESNIFRYRQLDNIVLRVQKDDALTDVLKVVLAAATCGTKLDISLSENCSFKLDSATVESDEAFIACLPNFENGRLRILSKVSDDVHVVVQNHHVQIVDQPVLDNGRLELRHYLVEQAISETTHRYGNITT